MSELSGDLARDGLISIHEALVDIMANYSVGFTCSEAEALYAAYQSIGEPEMAETFMCWHASLDEEEDVHEVTAEDNGIPIAWQRRDEEDE